MTAASARPTSRARTWWGVLAVGMYVITVVVSTEAALWVLPRWGDGWSVVVGLSVCVVGALATVPAVYMAWLR